MSPARRKVAQGIVASSTPELEASGVMGCARVFQARLDSEVLNAINEDDIIITDMIDLASSPTLLAARAIVTDLGGYTSHVALAANLIGIPCIVGAGEARLRIKTGELVQLTSEGEVYVIENGAR